MSRRFLAVFFLALCLVLGHAAAARPGGKQVSAPVKGFADTPVAEEAAALPPNFRGHNVLDIAIGLGVAPTKGEFEQTPDFEKRVAAWMAKPTLGRMTPASTYAIQLWPGPGSTPVEAKYDADDETLSLEVAYEDESDSPTQFNWLEAFRISKILGVRKARTTMNVPFEVESFSVSHIGLSLRTGMLPVKTEMKVSRTDAPKFKAGLRALALVTIDPPFSIHEKREKRASLDSPSEILRTVIGLHVTVREVWFYDFSTGLVHAKIKVPEFK